MVDSRNSNKFTPLASFVVSILIVLAVLTAFAFLVFVVQNRRYIFRRKKTTNRNETDDTLTFVKEDGDEEWGTFNEMPSSPSSSSPSPAKPYQSRYRNNDNSDPKDEETGEGYDPLFYYRYSASKPCHARHETGEYEKDEDKDDHIHAPLLSSSVPRAALQKDTPGEYEKDEDEDDHVSPPLAIPHSTPIPINHSPTSKESDSAGEYEKDEDEDNHVPPISPSTPITIHQPSTSMETGSAMQKDTPGEYEKDEDEDNHIPPPLVISPSTPIPIHQPSTSKESGSATQKDIITPTPSHTSAYSQPPHNDITPKREHTNSPSSAPPPPPLPPIPSSTGNKDPHLQRTTTEVISTLLKFRATKVIWETDESVEHIERVGSIANFSGRGGKNGGSGNRNGRSVRLPPRPLPTLPTTQE